MQSSSILCCCSNFPVKPIDFSVSRELFANSLRLWRPSGSVALSAVRLSATQDLVDSTSDSGFVETGYIYRVHGLQGEVKVKPATDFPELRFSKPGTRWLKRQVLGTEIMEEIKLVEGRGRPGQNWIVKFEDINTVEQAQKLVGSAILVTDQDRPVLEEGDFYTHDLIGMRVVLQETGEIVGTIANVFNNGASDLLHVELNSSTHRAWIPFVEAIVPTVSLEKREIVITPPKGLLELNIPKHEKSKKERRELEWKERKRLQRRLIAAKKKLCEMDQKHVFHGFQCGEKYQKSLLADQIVSLNSRLLQQALGDVKVNPSSRNLLRLLSSVPKSNVLRPLDAAYATTESKKAEEGGYNLMSHGKVTLVLVFEDTEENPSLHFEQLIDDGLGFVENAKRNSVPLVLVCPSRSIISLENLFRDRDYFGFDSKKTWFFEEVVLPVMLSEGENGHKIVMKTHWEFLQRPIGSGGVITLFSSHDPLLDQLTQLGVEYIQVSKMTEKREEARHALIGLVASREADLGVRICRDEDPETDLDVVFSVSFFRNVARRVLRFESVPMQQSSCCHVVEAAADNSFELLRCSIYGCLDFVAPEKVCVLFDSTS